MMSTAPPLTLTSEQASRLQVYLQTYRRHAFASLMPSVERNTTLRILQAMQGRLIDVMGHKTAVLQFALTMEEITTLKTMTTDLLMLYAKQPESVERISTLTDLAALRAALRS